MPKSPQDVYARHLLSPRGYPLWTPEPSQQLLAYRRDGLRIGDVGVVIPEDGCFDVFFNICLPQDHPFHRATGVPDSFEPIQLSDMDIRTVVNAENPGRVLANSSVKSARTVERPTGSQSSTRPPGPEYEFTLSSSEGALLILPEGAQRHDLRNHHRFLEAATQHGADWYRFAEEKVGQIIGNNSLYLITGFYKANSWSLAAFEKTAGTAEYPAQFRISQAGGENVAATYTWNTTRALDWRVGPMENYEFSNQAVFIRGFKVALRTGVFGTKWISVKADAPSTRSNPARSSGLVPGDSWLAYVFGGPSTGKVTQPSGSGTQDEVVVSSALEDARDEIQNKGALAVGEHVVIHRIPEASQAFHPSDIINQYLLNKKPSANIAITHDDVWITMLEENLLQPEDLTQEGKLETLASQKYDTISDGGAVYLRNRKFASSECLHQMVDEMVEGASTHVEEAEWVLGKLERLGDGAMDAGRHSDAVSHYSAALALHPALSTSLFIKRSKAYVAGGFSEAALNDANKVIELDPSSPWGYQGKHAALHKVGDYENAVAAFEEMLSKMSRSSDPEIRGQQHLYISPGEARMAIRHAVQDAIRDSPRVLINTTSGHLVDKSEQVSASEPLAVFNKLISSMTTNIDHARIQQDVTEYYRYAMFSHKWDDNEPLFEKVKDIAVYDLEASPTNDKLRMFCKIVRDAGLQWAWSDTCCINKADHFVLQEALVSMFKWYQGAAQTLVLLRGVRSPSRRGDLVKSIWNSRVWTFQEYHASKVVRFYNEDWTLYMNLDIPNHKESPEILSEMEEATGISARSLMALQPGPDDIREKLCLASRRETTLLEDEAYSLLGIFSMSLPVVYGEGDRALGRLLSQLVTSSGDTSILAWTGKSGSFNSCLPARISVFSQPLTSHILRTVSETEMETITARLRNASLSLNSITELYDRLDQLRVPSFLGKRMKLLCIIFKLGPVSSNRSKRVFQAQTVALGKVKIRTEEDLSQFKSLYLVHPWLDFLLDRQPVGSISETLLEESTNDQSSTIGDLPSLPGPSATALAAPRSRTRMAQLASRFGLSFGRQTATRPRDGDGASLRSPSSLSQTDKQTRALRTLARLSQPFSALLLTPSGNVAAYRRVATERAITVQVEEMTPAVLNKLIEGVSVLDVL